MSRLEKLYRRVKNNPKAVRFEELDRILRASGFVRRQPRGGSSHYVYKKGRKMVTVPYRKPHIKEAYVRMVIEAIEGGED